METEEAPVMIKKGNLRIPEAVSAVRAMGLWKKHGDVGFKWFDAKRRLAC